MPARPALSLRRGALRRLPAPAVDAGRWAIRAAGAATGWFRPPPDFLIIGAKRGGTTSLYYALTTHPQVEPLFPAGRWLPKADYTKGIHFFDTGYHHGAAWYRSHLPSTGARWLRARRHGQPVVTGEASPYYLYHPLAAERAAGMLPVVKIIVVLRDPIERTYSHYREQRRNGVERLTFAEALAAEAGRIAGEEERILRDPAYQSFAHENQSYQAQSEYAGGVRRWLDHYPRERCMVLASEEFYTGPQEAYDRVLRFLGLPSYPLADRSARNAAPRSPMDDKLRRRLAERFASHNAALEALLGQRFDWTAL